MRRRRWTVAVMAVVMTVLVAGCVASDLDGDSSWRDGLVGAAPVADPAAIPKGTVLWDIHNAGKLVYGGSKTQKLFSQLNPTTNELEGFDATMARLLAKYLTGSANVEPKIVTSETRESLLQNGTIQAVFYTYSITPEREKKVSFVGPYFNSGQSIAVRGETDDIHDVAGLAGRKVCVTKGGTAYTKVKAKVPTANLVTLESSTECEQMLRQRRVDAEVQDEAVLLGQAAKGGLRVIGDKLTYEPYGIGLPKSSPETVNFLNEWLRQLIVSGVWQKVYDHTVGTAPGAKADLPTPGKNANPNLKPS